MPIFNTTPVTSVGLTEPAEFSVAGSPITSSGTLAVSKATQNAHLVWAGPTSGGAAQPTFRSLVAGDLPTSSQNLYYALAYLSSPQTVANNTEAIIGYDTVVTDPNSNFTTGVAAKYTAPVAGHYLVTCTIYWASAVSSTYIRVYVNGSARTAGPQVDSSCHGILYSGIIRLNATDYVQMTALQGSGGNLNTGSSQEYMPISINYISPL
jgi:hypothetical protein